MCSTVTIASSSGHVLLLSEGSGARGTGIFGDEVGRGGGDVDGLSDIAALVTVLAIALVHILFFRGLTLLCVYELVDVSYAAVKTNQ